MARRPELFLRQVAITRTGSEDPTQHPWSLPAVRLLERVSLERPVTYFVGDNGTGKSTLLEAIAARYGFNPEGGSTDFAFATRPSHSELHQAVQLDRSPRRKPHTTFFLRAESFYNVATEIERLDAEPGNAPRIIDSYGGQSLHEMSHGESFFALLLHRFRGDGLYILDEPEAALSPMRQMSFLARLHQLVSEGSQFLIATHSPIVMAYPDATIWQLTPDSMQVIRYEETEHFQVTRQFLTHREAMLRELLA